MRISLKEYGIHCIYTFWVFSGWLKGSNLLCIFKAPLEQNPILRFQPKLIDLRFDKLINEFTTHADLAEPILTNFSEMFPLIDVLMIENFLLFFSHEIGAPITCCSKESDCLYRMSFAWPAKMVVCWHLSIKIGWKIPLDRRYRPNPDLLDSGFRHVWLVADCYIIKFTGTVI